MATVSISKCNCVSSSLANKPPLVSSLRRSNPKISGTAHSKIKISEISVGIMILSLGPIKRMQLRKIIKVRNKYRVMSNYYFLHINSSRCNFIGLMVVLVLYWNQSIRKYFFHTSFNLNFLFDGQKNMFLAKLIYFQPHIYSIL